MDALDLLRVEIEALCAETTPGSLLLCDDDPFLAELARRTPGSVRFGRDDVERRGDDLVLRVDGAAWPVGRDTVGGSGLRALSVAVRVGRLLGLGDRDIGRFLRAS